MSLVMSVSDQVVALELRPQDRRRHAGRGAARSGGDPGLPRERAPDMAALLEVEGPARRLRADAGAARRRLRARGGRHHDPARRQRRRQDDDAARALRHGAHRRARSASTAQRIDGKRHRGHRAPRHRPRARRPRHLRRPHGRGEPAPRRLRAQRQGRGRERTSSACYGYFPRLKRAPRAAGRHALGRRAADAGGRARADAAARACCCSTSRRSAWRR